MGLQPTFRVLAVLLFLSFVLVHAQNVATICTNCYPAQVIFPADTEYLLLLSNSTVIKSVDEGSYWRHIFGNIKLIRQFPNNPEAIIMFTQFQPQQFVWSADGGDSFSLGTFPSPIVDYNNNLILHPTNPGWMIFFGSSYNTIAQCTKNWGATWTQFNSSIKFIQSAAWSVNPNTPDTFFAIYNYTDDFTTLFGYTNDFGVTWTSLVENAVGFDQTEHFMFVAVNLGVEGQGIRLVSNSVYNDPTHTDPTQYKMVTFSFGGNIYKELAYEYLDDTSNSEIIGVFTNGSNSVVDGQAWGSVFYSDFNGQYFSTSIPRISVVFSDYDFEPVQSLQGVFLANVMASNSSSTLKQTKITFDNGGDWRFLTSPTKDFYGNPINCSLANGCSLHLHGTPSWNHNGIPYFYSVPNAIGLIIANGNTGNTLSYDVNHLSTYLSRDGGLTWKQLFNETTVYDVGDHGGLILFASLSPQGTKDLYYTADEGATIVPIRNAFPYFVHVYNIMGDSSGVSRKFVVLGVLSGSSTPVMYSVDFTTVFNTPCDPVIDYERWTASDAGGDPNCFMGATTVYIRRSPDAACYNTISDHIFSSNPCPCAFEDYECDIYFVPSPRNETDGFTCTSINATNTPSCATGYRLVPATQCTLTNGLNLNSQSCPGYSLGTLTLTSTTSSSISTTSSSSSSSASPTTGSTNMATITSSTMDSPTTSTSSTPAPDHGTTTTGKHNGGGGGAGKAVGLTFLFLILGVAAVVGILYWKHPRFHDWVDAKLGRRSDAVYEPINPKGDF